MIRIDITETADWGCDYTDADREALEQEHPAALGRAGAARAWVAGRRGEPMKEPSCMDPFLQQQVRDSYADARRWLVFARDMLHKATIAKEDGAPTVGLYLGLATDALVSALYARSWARLSRRMARGEPTAYLTVDPWGSSGVRDIRAS